MYNYCEQCTRRGRGTCGDISYLHGARLHVCDVQSTQHPIPFRASSSSHLTTTPAFPLSSLYSLYSLSPSPRPLFHRCSRSATAPTTAPTMDTGAVHSHYHMLLLTNTHLVKQSIGASSRRQAHLLPACAFHPIRRPARLNQVLRPEQEGQLWNGVWVSPGPCPPGGIRRGHRLPPRQPVSQGGYL